MEISFRGRGARAGRNNNLLTSHARNTTRYLASAHAFKLPLLPSPPPFRRPAQFCTGPASRMAADRVSRNCHLSSRRFTIPFTPARQRRRRYRTVPGRPEVSERFISARLLVYPPDDNAAHRASFYRSRYLRFSATSSHFASRKLRAVLVELSLSKLRYRDYFFEKSR